MEFVGKELYDANGTRWTRYKLSVTNRASLPDSLWQPSASLPPCGKNENASRTWVEIFGSLMNRKGPGEAEAYTAEGSSEKTNSGRKPGDERLNGFCGLRSSEDLNQLWFAIPAGEKGPPCVYIVMTDRQTGTKYISNRVCSRSFTVVTGGFKAGGQTQQIQKGKEIWIELNSTQINDSPANVQGGSGKDRIFNSSRGSTVQQTDSGASADKKAALAQPDLSIRQFLFPPTNDKALRVRVVNTGQAPSAACRLVLTVRKINGVAVGRTTYVNVPALAAGAADWLLIDAKSILPNNVSLQSTTFRLNVDATAIVSELNEANNEVWHNK